MKIALNREYLLRHLFVVVLMLGFTFWFGYDGYVRYPATDAAALYASIEGAEPPTGTSAAELAKFKAQKISFQRMFALAALLAAGLIGLRLASSARFDLRYDEKGFTVGAKRYGYADVKAVDSREWEAKRLARVTLADGRRIVLDAWHHVGVKEFYEKIKSPVDTERKI